MVIFNYVIVPNGFHGAVVTPDLQKFEVLSKTISRYQKRLSFALTGF
jgi:hypothetical protein